MRPSTSQAGRLVPVIVCFVTLGMCQDNLNVRKADFPEKAIANVVPASAIESMTPKAIAQPEDTFDLKMLAEFCSSQRFINRCLPTAQLCTKISDCPQQHLCTCQHGCGNLTCQPMDNSGECRRHPVPSNGYVIDRYTEVEFFCNHGHSLSGPRRKVCVKGQWNPQNKFPRCQTARCRGPLPRAPEHGHIEFHMHIGKKRRHAGTQVVYSCDEGYTLSGATYRKCMHSGNWSGSQPSCHRNGGWGNWSDWSDCSVLCGVGVSLRQRECDEPTPDADGLQCPGNNTEEQICSGPPCPIHGGWTDWGDWSECNVTCGAGYKSRYRSCSDPVPQHGGTLCVGKKLNVAICHSGVECPVHGRWSKWTNWSSCSVSCGVGVWSHTRRCDSPAPRFGGRECEGSAWKKARCDTGVVCPIHGGWSKWREWSACSASCESGVRMRGRACQSPVPQFGGKDCPGRNWEEEICHTRVKCPVHGNWSKWSDWSKCSVTCGEGRLSRSRHCNDPPPQHGGVYCEGQSRDEKICTEKPCPVHGRWNSWLPWSVCDAQCSKGLQHRTRTCDEPRHGGRQCLGKWIESRVCNTNKPCPAPNQLGCFDRLPWRGYRPEMKLTSQLRTVHRCLHSCRLAKERFATFRGQTCWCTNHYILNNYVPCSASAFHVYVATQHNSCRKRISFLERFQVPVMVYRRERYTTSCGFWGWSRCTRHRTLSSHGTVGKYRQSYRIVPC